MRYRTQLRTNRTHETYRDAESPRDAAAQACKGWYLDAVLDATERTNKDMTGNYIEFIARTSYSRIPATVKVYVK